MNVIETVFVMVVVATCVTMRQKIALAGIITFPDIFSTQHNIRHVQNVSDAEHPPCPDHKKCDGDPPLIIKPVIIKLYRYPNIDNNRTFAPKTLANHENFSLPPSDFEITYDESRNTLTPSRRGMSIPEQQYSEY